jgi:hypothetical protein
VIYDGQDGVLAIVSRKPSDQVHGYLLERQGVFSRRDSVEWGFLLVCENLVLLTCRASFHIFCYPRVHPWPLYMLSSFVEGFIPAWVSCGGVVMY